MSWSDDDLLGALGDALLPEPDATPSPQLLAAVQRAVADARESGAPVRVRSYRRPRWVVVAAATFGTLGVSSAAFAVSGEPLPRPVRQVAHAIGLPVDSPDLADTRTDVGDLRDALHAGDVAAITILAQQVRADIADLDPHDRKQLGGEVDDLLSTADTHHGSGDDKGHGDDSSSAAPSSDDGGHAPAGDDSGPGRRDDTPAVTAPGQDGSHSRGGSDGSASTPAPSASEESSASSSSDDGGQGGASSNGRGGGSSNVSGHGSAN